MKDSEAKLFEYVALIAEEGKEHVINLLSERCMCESCRDVMRQFKEKHPNVKGNEVSNSKNRLRRIKIIRGLEG